jgi:hypothetical protein
MHEINFCLIPLHFETERHRRRYTFGAFGCPGVIERIGVIDPNKASMAWPNPTRSFAA